MRITNFYSGDKMQEIEKMKEHLKGTTTVAVKTKEGVVFAADKRATMGSLIAHKKVEKIIELEEHIAMTTAGAVGDAQAIARWAKAEASLYRMRKGEEISVEAMATLIGNILHAMRYYPLFVQLIVGGYDSKGGRIFSIDIMGSVIEDRIIASGSGSPVAYGVLEAEYREDMNIEEAEALAVKALKSALERDAMSGNGVDVVIITRDGIEKKEI